jgi:hypothetical protein
LPKRERKLVKQFLEERSISENVLLEVLQDKLFSFFDVLTTTQDQQKIRSMLESRFADKILSNLDKIKASKIQFKQGQGLCKIKKDQNDYGALKSNLVSDIDQSYMIDNLLIKGLSVNRSENYSNFDYNLYTNLEEAGIRMYTHKFFKGYQHYYFMQKYKEKVERAD